MTQTATAPKPVPLFELATQYQAIRREVEAAVREVLESQMYTGGPAVERFEKNLGEKLGGHVVAVSSGTDAILAAHMALGIGRGAEVITTPFTFFATAGCIVRAGARPVFVDIEPDTFLINHKAIIEAITPHTKAILPVHLYGQMGDTQALAELAAKHKLAVIEDAAQSIGDKDANGTGLATNARCACLSFYPTKNLGAAGDAGALVTTDAALATRFRQTRQHGEVTRYHHEFVGGNFRLDAIQCAVLDVKLKYLDQWNNQRRTIAAYYTSRFTGTDVIPPAIIPGAYHVFHQYIIRVPRRDALKDHLTKHGVGCNIFYPKPLHLQACFADLAHKRGDFPVAEKTADEVLALPIFPELTDAQIQRVADVVLSFYH